MALLSEIMWLAAREYAAQGMPIFPLTENSKRPATASGFYDATLDLEQIDAWWGPDRGFPQVYNIGCCPEDCGCFVVDCDPPSGLVNFEQLKLKFPGIGSTVVIETPRGGRHYWYKGQLPSSAGKIAPNIDIRGIGGYVLLPPSVIEGRSYKVINEGGGDGTV